MTVKVPFSPFQPIATSSNESPITVGIARIRRPRGPH